MEGEAGCPRPARPVLFMDGRVPHQVIDETLFGLLLRDRVTLLGCLSSEGVNQGVLEGWKGLCRLQMSTYVSSYLHGMWSCMYVWLNMCIH